MALLGYAKIITSGGWYQETGWRLIEGMNNISGTWPKAKQQMAYERRVQAEGLAALLEPYRGALPQRPAVVRVPSQRGSLEVRVAA